MRMKESFSGMKVKKVFDFRQLVNFLGSTFPYSSHMTGPGNVAVTSHNRNIVVVDFINSLVSNENRFMGILKLNCVCFAWLLLAYVWPYQDGETHD